MGTNVRGLKALLALAASALTLTVGNTAHSPRFQVLAHADPKGGYSGDVVGERHYAYLSSRRGTGNDCPAQGVRIYDLANPRRPRHVATFADGRSTPELAQAWTEKTIVKRVKTSGFDGVLAVTSVQACGNGFGGFALYDVTHPRSPVEVGGWSACRDLHECTPLDGPPGKDVRYFVHSVITNSAATRAYLSYWNLGTVILDISDPSRPRYLGRTPAGQGNVHSAWLADHGRILLETHEVPHGRAVVWNIAKPARPRRLATVRLPARLRPGGAYTGLDLADSVHDPKAVGKVAYFSWYAQGVALFDLARPGRPRFLTRFRPPPEPDEHGLLCPGSSCTAVWGVFPMRKYVLASDLNSGLWVVHLQR